MQSAPGIYPVRMFIRHKARHKLIAATAAPQVDEALLQDLMRTLVRPEVAPAVFQAYPSRDQALRVEETVADDIASSYLRIVQQQADPLVQQLNSLL